jgi:hypothetical protein
VEEFSLLMASIAKGKGDTLSPRLRECWEHHYLLRNLTETDPIIATGTNVSVIAHCTPDELRRTLRTVDISNGFGNRFIWLAARGVKAVPDPKAIDWAEHPAIVKELRNIVQNFRVPVDLDFTPKGKEVWETWYKGYREQKQTFKGTFEELAGRCEPHVLRLAAIYTVLDNQQLIDEIHLAAAWAFWRYCADSIRWAFPANAAPLNILPGVSRIPTNRANKLRAALRAHPQGMTRTQISKVFGGNLAKEEIEEALNLLRESGSATEKPEVKLWLSTENEKNEKN